MFILKKKKYYIVIIFLIILLFLYVFYLAIDYKNKGTISGIVIKEGQLIVEELDFDEVYFDATVEIYSIAKNNKQELNNKKFVKRIQTDKDGKFTTIVHPGTYKVIAYRGDDLKSDILDVEVKIGKVSWLKIYLSEI